MTFNLFEPLNNGFSLEIIRGNGFPPVKLMKEGYTFYAMPNLSTYKIKLSNNNAVRTDATIYIDGTQIGVFRISSYGSIIVERPTGIERKFTLIKEGTDEGVKAGIIPGNFENGLIKVVFRPEKKHNHFTDHFALDSYDSKKIRSNSYQSTNCYSQENYSSAGTGLGEHSNQRFYETSILTSIDLQKVTTLYARLVVDEDQLHDDIIPLKSSIPPRINDIRSFREIIR